MWDTKQMIYCLIFFFFNDTATTEIYTLSLHDALPISAHHQHQRHEAGELAEGEEQGERQPPLPGRRQQAGGGAAVQDRKSTRLNSSHANISYAVFCLKKKKYKKKLTVDIVQSHNT